MSRRRACQHFTVVLPDGTSVQGHGQFSGPLTDMDRKAIAEVVAELKRYTHAERIESVSFTKAD
jgi:hypothetical protein